MTEELRFTLNAAEQHYGNRVGARRIPNIVREKFKVRDATFV